MLLRFEPENCYELEDEVGLCLQGQVKASCSNEKQKVCKEVLPLLERCEDDWCLRRTVETYSQFIVKGKDDVADVIIHVNEGESCTFGDVLWFSDSLVSMSVLKDQVPFEKGSAYKRQKNYEATTTSIFSLSILSCNRFARSISGRGCYSCNGQLNGSKTTANASWYGRKS